VFGMPHATVCPAPTTPEFRRCMFTPSGTATIISPTGPAMSTCGMAPHAQHKVEWGGIMRGTLLGAAGWKDLGLCRSLTTDVGSACRSSAWWHWVAASFVRTRFTGLKLTMVTWATWSRSAVICTQHSMCVWGGGGGGGGGRQGRVQSSANACQMFLHLQ
jgi:hypothetical protein